MTDIATPNLPSRDFNSTVAFYAPLGFEVGYRSEGWLILDRGSLKLEFFLDPAHDPFRSSFGTCLRMGAIDPLIAQIEEAGVPQRTTGQPRWHPPRVEASGLRIAYVVDPEGSLLRLIES